MEETVSQYHSKAERQEKGAAEFERREQAIAVADRIARPVGKDADAKFQAELDANLEKKCAAAGMLPGQGDELPTNPSERAGPSDGDIVRRIGFLSHRTHLTRLEVERHARRLLEFDGTRVWLHQLWQDSLESAQSASAIVAKVVSISGLIESGVMRNATADAVSALMLATRPETSVEPDSEFGRALAQVEFRVEERARRAAPAVSPEAAQSWIRAVIREECNAAVPGDKYEDAHTRVALFNRAIENHRQKGKTMPQDDAKTPTPPQLFHELGRLRRELVEARQAYDIERNARQSARKAADSLHTERAEIADKCTQLRARIVKLSVIADRLTKKNERLSQQLEKAGQMNHGYTDATEQEPMTATDLAAGHAELVAERLLLVKERAALVAGHAELKDLLAEPIAEIPGPVDKPAPGGLPQLLTDAVTLATVQQSSKLAVAKISPLLVKAGVPEALVMDPRAQGVLELALPFLIAKYGSMVPGLKRMETVQTLSQQQLVIGIAEIIGVSVMDLLKIGMDIVTSLNEGADATVEQLKDNLSSE